MSKIPLFGLNDKNDDLILKNTKKHIISKNTKNKNLKKTWKKHDFDENLLRYKDIFSYLKHEFHFSQNLEKTWKNIEKTRKKDKKTSKKTSNITKCENGVFCSVRKLR